MKTQQNKFVKKLQLNKRTIVMLNEQGMNNLNGGNIPTDDGDTGVGTTTPKCIGVKTKDILDPKCEKPKDPSIAG